MTPAITNRHDQPILTVCDWEALAPPASKQHWVDGRSAKELAKAWIEGAGPEALRTLLEMEPGIGGFTVDSAVAEAQTTFDQWPGGKRNHDLLIRGRSATGPMVVGLEAKADETFGPTVGAYMAAAETKWAKRESSNAGERLAGLLEGIVGASLAERPELSGLRYQLFSAIAGTLAAAKAGEHAAFIVHEFKADNDREEAESQWPSPLGLHDGRLRREGSRRRGMVAARPSGCAGRASGEDSALGRAHDDGWREARAADVTQANS